MLNSDIVAALITAALKQQQEAGKCNKPADPFGKKETSDAKSKAEKSAGIAKEFLDAYLAQGFSRSEAFELVKNNLNTKI